MLAPGVSAAGNDFTFILRERSARVFYRDCADWAHIARDFMQARMIGHRRGRRLSRPGASRRALQNASDALLLILPTALQLTRWSVLRRHRRATRSTISAPDIPPRICLSTYNRTALCPATHVGGSGRMCALAPSSRFTGGLRMTWSPAVTPLTASTVVPRSRATDIF